MLEAYYNNLKELNYPNATIGTIGCPLDQLSCDFILSFLFCFLPYLGIVTSSLCLSGQFVIQKVVPRASGESSKVKVKVRVNVHGVFSVSSAALVEVIKDTEGEEPMETDQAVKEEEVCICFGCKKQNVAVRQR